MLIFFSLLFRFCVAGECLYLHYFCSLYLLTVSPAKCVSFSFRVIQKVFFLQLLSSSFLLSLSFFFILYLRVTQILFILSFSLSHRIIQKSFLLFSFVFTVRGGSTMANINENKNDKWPRRGQFLLSSQIVKKKIFASFTSFSFFIVSVKKIAHRRFGSWLLNLERVSPR